MERKISVPLAGASGHAHLTKPGAPANIVFELGAGQSVVLVGANGSGKTRLGASIEAQVGQEAHRIAAQRSLRIEPRVTLHDYDVAIAELREGSSSKGNRHGYRWRNDPSVTALDDYEHLLRALFAEQNRTLIRDHTKRKQGEQTAPPQTKLDKLYAIWRKVLPQRDLQIKDASIDVLPPKNPPGTGGDTPYPPSQMSDGERVIFYLIGQCLLAPENGVVIIDEPELHIHPSISELLWDEIETERQDCAFVYITHDLEFAANRIAAKKYFVKAIHYNSFWEIEKIPEATGLPQDLVIQLVGNRSAVLFVEGDVGSIDVLLYRSVYHDMKVEPRGSCASVIHSVASFRANPTLHKLGSVFGCVDADHRSPEQEGQLNAGGVKVLKVAEVENVLLLPEVFLEIAKALSLPDERAKNALQTVSAHIIEKALAERENVAARFLSRRIDERLKSVTLSRRSLDQLKLSFAEQIAGIDLSVLADEFRAKFDGATGEKNITSLLALFDQKGLLDFGARELGIASGKELAVLVSRFAIDERHKGLGNALRSALPSFLLVKL